MGLNLRIVIPELSAIRDIDINSTTIVFDACRYVMAKEGFDVAKVQDYGLFVPDQDDCKKGFWLEPGRSLEYYLLRDGDKVEFKKKSRILKVKTLDGSVKTLLVDDSQPVSHIMITICSKLGITNHEEYSLSLQDQQLDDKSFFDTLKRDKTLTKEQRKMGQMKRKLNTDDNISWIDPVKSLRDQGVIENEILVLRRKYFFSDKNIDARDPIQLNLLFVQCRDAIINGTHPVTFQQACEFAGMQCQIQFGDYNPAKHRPGYLEISDFMAKDYRKVKGFEKKIFEEHKKYANCSELETQYKYIQLAQSLSTYGVTFFLVKEKMKGKNKLVPRLLGVNKDSVLRLDEKTKEILKTWPLTCIKRWAASPNSFTLDFGDYQERYYSVQTLDGEQIARLISGYIDIILKQKEREFSGIEGTESTSLLEDIVSPHRATIIEQNKIVSPTRGEISSIALEGNLMSLSDKYQVSSPEQMAHDSFQSFSTCASNFKDSMPKANTSESNEITSNKFYSAQKDLQNHVENCLQRVRFAHSKLQSGEEEDIQNRMPDKDDDETPLSQEDGKKSSFSKSALYTDVSSVYHSSSKIANICSLTTSESHALSDCEYKLKLESALESLASASESVCHHISTLRRCGGRSSSEENALLDAARSLADATTAMILCVHANDTFYDNLSYKQRENIEGTLVKLSDCSNDLLMASGAYNERSLYTYALNSCTKSLANETANLIIKANCIASNCCDISQQKRLIAAATACAMSTSQLVSACKILCPLAYNADCQDQIAKSADKVSSSVSTVCDYAIQANESTNSEMIIDLESASERVNLTLKKLLLEFNSGSMNGQDVMHVPSEEPVVERINCAADNLVKISLSNPSEMIKQARVVAQTTSKLVLAIKGQAEKSNSVSSQRKLLTAAKTLANATSYLVEVAKGCASIPETSITHQRQPHPNAHVYNERLLQAANKVKMATQTANSDILSEKTNSLFQILVWHAMNATNHAISVSYAAISYASDQSLTQKILHDCEKTKEIVQDLYACSSEMFSSTKFSYDRSSDSFAPAVASLGESIQLAEEFVQIAGSLVESMNQLNPIVSHVPCRKNLGDASRILNLVISEVKVCTQTASKACDPLKIKSLLSHMDELEFKLKEIQSSLSQTSPPDTSCLNAFQRSEGMTESICIDLPDSAIQRVTYYAKVTGSYMAQLITSAAQGNQSFSFTAAQSTLKCLSCLLDCVCFSCKSCSAGHSFKLLEALHQVLLKSIALFEEAGVALDDLKNAKNHQNLAQAARNVSISLNHCINSLPGQSDLDSAINVISESSAILQSPTLGNNGLMHSFEEIQKSFKECGVALSEAATQLVTATKNANLADLSFSANKYSTVYKSFLSNGVSLASLQKEKILKEKILLSLKSVSHISNDLLCAAKSCSVDPSSFHHKNRLLQAAKAVSETVNELITTCTSNMSTESKYLDMAVKKLLSCRQLFSDSYISVAVSSNTYFESFDSAMTSSKSLGDCLKALTTAARNNDFAQLETATLQTANVISSIIEEACQCVYLVGVSHFTSVGGRPSVINISSVHQSANAISKACADINLTKSSQQQILSAATIIAKHTSSLCNQCRVASSKTSNINAKQVFVQSAKDVANATAYLVKCIKKSESKEKVTTPTTTATEGVLSKVEACHQVDDAIQSLFDCVDNLVAFASSPEFSPLPAQLSDEAKGCQKSIISVVETLLERAVSLLKSLKLLSSQSSNPQSWATFSSNSQSVSDSIKSVVSLLRENSPGQGECQESLNKIGVILTHLEQASSDAISQQLLPRKDDSLHGFHEQFLRSIMQTEALIEGIKISGKMEPETLAQKVRQFTSYLQALLDSSTGFASKIIISQQQIALLDQSKSVVEASLQFVTSVKECGGNHKATKLHDVMHESSVNLKEAIEDIKETLQSLGDGSEIIMKLVELITNSLSRLTLPHSPSASLDSRDAQLDPDFDFARNQVLSSSTQQDSEGMASYQSQMVHSCKEIAKNAQEIASSVLQNNHQVLARLNASGASHLSEYGNLTSSSLTSTHSLSHDENKLTASLNLICQNFTKLVHNVSQFSACVYQQHQSHNQENQLSQQIQQQTREIADSCISLIKSTPLPYFNSVNMKASSYQVQKALVHQAKCVNEKISDMLSLLQENFKGTQACISASHLVKNLVTDLDTAILFATAGNLSSGTEDDEIVQFADHREVILKTAKALVEDTKVLVAGAASSQEKLAKAAESAVITVTDLSSVVKNGATSIGSQDSHAQIMLINAAKDVLTALGDLIQATKLASGNSIHHPSMTTLKDSAKVMVTNVTSLLKTVKVIEDKSLRSTRVLESTIEILAQETKNFEVNCNNNNLPASSNLLPLSSYISCIDDVIHCTYPISSAVSSFLSSCSNPTHNGVVIASNAARTSISNLLQHSLVPISHNTHRDDAEIKEELKSNVMNCAFRFRILLQNLHKIVLGNPYESEIKSSCKESAYEIAQYVNSVVFNLQSLKNLNGINNNLQDNDADNSEDELNLLANAILSHLKNLENFSLRDIRIEFKTRIVNFDEEVIAGCYCITQAAAELVKCAMVVKQEVSAHFPKEAAGTHHHLAASMNNTASSLDDSFEYTKSFQCQYGLGLCSAARVLSIAIRTLCEGCVSYLKEVYSEEKLISSIKQVASSSAALLVASRIKASTSSCQKLSDVGQNIKRVTERLVAVVMKFMEEKVENKKITLDQSIVGSLTQEIEAQQQILQKERELEEARVKLGAIRKAKYVYNNSNGSTAPNNMCEQEQPLSSANMMASLVANPSFVSYEYSSRSVMNNE